MKGTFISTILLIIVTNVFSQTDNKFWFAAPEIDEVASSIFAPFDRPIYLRMTAGDNSANVSISIPANLSFAPINFSIAANATTTIDLTSAINLIENTNANQISKKGLLIQATNPISAYYEVNSTSCQCNPELFSLKGGKALGNTFFIPSQSEWAIDTVRHPFARAAFDIVATEDNTSIIITPKAPLLGRPANLPFNITLQKGETFSCQALYRNGLNLLGGSKVVATKPIAITTKEDVLFADGLCADLAGDQLIPTDIMGNEFIVIKGQLTPRDKVVIIASKNNTSIFLNGNTSSVALINEGERFEIDLTTAPSLFIATNEPTLVYHYTGNGCEVGAAVIPKIKCTGSNSISLVRSNLGNSFLLLVTKAGNQSGFLFNGSATVITAADFLPVNGTAGAYVYCKKDVSFNMPTNTATKIVNTNGTFQLGFLNGDSPGYMYGYFSDFKSLTTINSQFEICRFDTVQLNAIGGSNYNWSPATGLNNTNISNPKASPNISTTYKVIVTDLLGCVDSSFVKVNLKNTKGLSDFTFDNNACNIFDIKFKYEGASFSNIFWNFGSLGSSSLTNPNFTFPNSGLFKIKLITNNLCTDTIEKNLNLELLKANVIITPDSVACKNINKLINGVITDNYCWYPILDITNINSNNPTVNIATPRTYFYNAKIQSSNLILNSNFNDGNTNFVSSLSYTNINTGDNQYTINTNPAVWNNTLASCKDHTTGTGNFLLANSNMNLNIWSQNINVIPNTNYEFSLWVQSLSTGNTSKIQLNINDVNLSLTTDLPATVCEWSKIKLYWNSGNLTTANLKINSLNINTTNNFFALDDISFNKINYYYDSINIDIDTSKVYTTKQRDVDCKNPTTQINAFGASSYTWTPAQLLLNPNIQSPLATVYSNTTFFVNGTSNFGCITSDSINISFIGNTNFILNIPNAFSPNNDGINDEFGIAGLQNQNFVLDYFAIYNRWGNEIFVTKNANAKWNGTFKNKDQPTGVYIYTVKLKNPCGEFYKKGTVTLIK